MLGAFSDFISGSCSFLGSSMVGEEKMSLRNRLSKSGENPEQDEAQRSLSDTQRNGEVFNVSEVNW